MRFIARDADSEGDLIAWYEGDAQGASPAQLTCALDEVAVIVVDGEASRELPPGRHPLTAEDYEELTGWLEGDDESVDFAFLTTSPVTLELAGDYARGEDEASFTARAVVQVTSGTEAIGLLENLADDESLEDWLADEVAVHLVAALDEHPEADLLELSSGALNEELEASTLERANEALTAFGISVKSVAFGELVLEPETLHRVAKRLKDAAYRQIAATGHLQYDCPKGHGPFTEGQVLCPVCGAFLRAAK
jgi:hypothetical protein